MIHDMGSVKELWLETLDQVQEAGRKAGITAASWWPVNGPEDAQRILTGMDDGDPEILDWLPYWRPNLDSNDHEIVTGTDVWALARDLCPDLVNYAYDENDPRCMEATVAYEIGFEIGAHDEITRRCTYQLEPPSRPATYNGLLTGI